MRTFLPIGEAAQADYEDLRAAALAGTPVISPMSTRFQLGGLGALILSTSTPPPCFVAELMGASRPPWAPYGDPRAEALAESYGLLVGTGEDLAGLLASRDVTAKEA